MFMGKITKMREQIKCYQNTMYVKSRYVLCLSVQYGRHVLRQIKAVQEMSKVGTFIYLKQRRFLLNMNSTCIKMLMCLCSLARIIHTENTKLRKTEATTFSIYMTLVLTANMSNKLNE